MSTYTATPILLDQISLLRRSGDKIRTRAPLIQQWPWENGIALEHGSMSSRMQQNSTGRVLNTFETMVLVSSAISDYSIPGTSTLVEICQCPGLI
jgi:hypothetical protein